MDGDAPSSGIEHTKATFVVWLVFPTRADQADSCSERLPLLAESLWRLSKVGLRGWLGAAYDARSLHFLSTIEFTDAGAILVVAPGRLGGWATGGFVRSVSHLRLPMGHDDPTRAKGCPFLGASRRARRICYKTRSNTETIHIKIVRTASK